MREKSNQTSVVFGAAIHRISETYWSPSADIYRTRNGWLIKYDLQITIHGFRRDWRLEDGCSHYSMEISYNRFERTVELPGNLEGAQVQIEGREGILLVRLTCQGETP